MSPILWWMALQHYNLSCGRWSNFFGCPSLTKVVPACGPHLSTKDTNMYLRLRFICLLTVQIVRVLLCTLVGTAALASHWTHKGTNSAPYFSDNVWEQSWVSVGYSSKKGIILLKTNTLHFSTNRPNVFFCFLDVISWRVNLQYIFFFFNPHLSGWCV